eukprot:CAMPEP_0181189548 /NCGR_PEP_ID=MMETSP1096-20121128/11716_1 /TAXON_ID=156174 ORGANISM="Chrysochromulina ericina, Strain CCMP281" /NCGR_SAMPLE_ID=MMETSP1096 /ASSEMBLY_ACC=CAM_ASM_000453 /LENGTH=101 /DNA_ID=CAMNT_0023278699 /DNA_START=374 /DNA_END=679 /DNA_ORIENTATION=-
MCLRDRSHGSDGNVVDGLRLVLQPQTLARVVSDALKPRRGVAHFVHIGHGKIPTAWCRRQRADDKAVAKAHDELLVSKATCVSSAIATGLGGHVARHIVEA